MQCGKENQADRGHLGRREKTLESCGSEGRVACVIFSCITILPCSLQLFLPE